jgi:hypothetical protein
MPTVVRILAFLFTAAALGAAPAAAQEKIWHYSPYQMRVWVALAPAAELNEALERQILRTLVERAEAVALAPWTLTSEPAPGPMRGAMLAGLEWMTVEQLSPPPEKNDQPSSSSVPSTAALSAGASSTPSEAADLPLPGGADIPEIPASPAPPRPDYTELLETHDKLTLVRVAPDRGGFLVEARELDCRTRQWSAVFTRRAPHAALIALEAFRAVEEAFRPVARIEQVKGNAVTVRLRAGGLVETPESPAHLPEGTVLLPVVRLNDRHGRPRENGIQIASWAYIVPKETIGAGRLSGELVAGVATPLGARSSSRMEKYGLAAPVRHEKTEVILRARPLSRTDTEPPPLASYEVHERLPGAEELTFVARSDWRGLVEIEKTEHPIRVLYVKNGSRILSKFPVVPGLVPRVEVNVMNDDRRLEVEGFVSGLQSRIMDLIVAREVMALRIRNRIRDGKLDEAEELMKEFRLLPTRDQVQAELNREEARQRSLPTDRATKALIDKLFNETRGLITKHLEPTLAQTLERELVAARSGG